MGLEPVQQAEELRGERKGYRQLLFNLPQKPPNCIQMVKLEDKVKQQRKSLYVATNPRVTSELVPRRRPEATGETTIRTTLELRFYILI